MSNTVFYCVNYLYFYLSNKNIPYLVQSELFRKVHLVCLGYQQQCQIEEHVP